MEILYTPSFMNRYTVKGELLRLRCNLCLTLGRKSSDWSAARITKQLQQFSWPQMKAQPDTNPVYFTGEMVISIFDVLIIFVLKN